MKTCLRFPAVLPVMSCLVLLLLAACTSESPALLSPEQVTWVPYQSDTMGISLNVPKSWTVSEDDQDGVIFRQEGYPVLVITLLDEERSESRGLWARYKDQATGSDTVSGQTAHRYAYVHQDVIFFMPTISWVIPWRGQFLELAFRTGNNEPEPLQRMILDGLLLAAPDSQSG